MLTATTTMLSNFLRWTILVAASTKGGSISLATVLVAVALLLALGLAVAAFVLIRQRPATPESLARGLFRQLSRAHQLTGAQSALVWQLGRLLKLHCPAVLFVDSSAWRIPEGNLDKKDWDKLLKIQKMLFQPPGAA